MQKVDLQHQQHNQPVRQDKGAAVDPPLRGQIVQLEAMAESSSQVGKQANLATTIDASPAMAAQRRMEAMVNNSPRQAAQRKLVESIGNSPRQVEQRQKLENLFGGVAQREEVEAPLQAAQREEASAKPNSTGLPENLKAGVESLSGMSLDNVKVHYNSSQPAQLNALAYAQGTDIHVAPGQEQHLPHEAWHVVQQAQGRVRPTMQMKDGVPVNDDKGLEREADVMGGRALQMVRQVSQTIEPAPIETSNAYLVQKVKGRDNFNKKKREKILEKNKRARKNNGFYTCANCGFQHMQLHYATYRGKRLGDGCFQVDHITPASHGGRALSRNARVLCGTCNTSRGNRAAAKRTGINKYRGIHKGATTKDYLKIRRSY